MMIHRHVRFQNAVAFSAACVCALLVSLSAAGQIAGDDPDVSLEDLRQAIESSQSLSETDQELSLAAVATAEVAMQEASDLLSRAESLRFKAEAAPAALEAVRSEMEQAADLVDAAPPVDATVAELEQQLAQISADLRAAREALRSLEHEAETRRTRRVDIPDELAAALLRQEALEEEQTLPSDGLLGMAESAAASARLDRARAEVELLQAEMLSYDARQELLPARRDRAVRRMTRLEELERQWQAIVQTARQAQARQDAQDAGQLQRQAAAQSAVLAAFAEVNEALARSRASSDGLPQQLARTERNLAQARQQLADLQSQYSTVSRRLSTSGLSRATGIVLRRQYDALPELSILRQRLAETREQLEEAEMRLVDWQELRLGAGDIEATVSALKRTTREASPGVDVESAEFEAVARQLAEARRDLLNQLIADSTTSFDQLLALEELRATLLDAARRYREFIGERILWVRSISDDQSDLASAAVDLAPSAFLIESGEAAVDPRAALRRILETIRANIALAALACLAIVATVLAVVWNRRLSGRLAQRVKSYRSDRLSLTYLGLGAASVIAMLAAAAWWLLAIVFTDGAGDSVAVASLGWGFGHTLQLVAGLLLVLPIFARNGLAEAHFRWPKPAVTATRRHMRWFAPAFAVLVLIAVSIDHTSDESLNASVGRAAFSASQVIAAVFGWLILRPRGPVLREYIAKRKGSAVRRLLVATWVAAVVVPLALTAISWMGYHYTALELARRFGLTVGLILLVVLANAMLMRWLFIARRRVAIEDAKRRREQALAEAAEAEPDEEGPTESSLPPIDEDKLDLPAISGQTTQLFRVAVAVSLAIGLLGIWSSVLPALRALDQVQIWPSVQITEAATDPGIESLDEDLLASGSPAERPSTDLTTSTAEPSGDSSALLDPTGLTLGGPASDGGTADSDKPTVITLADIGLSLVIGFVAIAAFRNVPGLAEIFVLQRLPLDAASRFALATVLRYAIGFAGVLATAAVLGIAWDKVQWLAAALTFGLAFGLQEIFANFVSGLIILAERPVRIGDTVTVGNVTGTVTRIRMRATTVTDWDRKELVIPNRQFITDQVINWTLSDAILRVIVPVGVAYGSDVALVEKTLLEIGEKNNTVLDTPKHYVLFRDFGDSTLNFELRIFIPAIEHLLTVQHQLRVEIDRLFRERNIEIAFPQRDLHIRTADPIVELADRIRETSSKGPKT